LLLFSFFLFAVLLSFLLQHESVINFSSNAVSKTNL
jgi:hypothetical protein